jgi:ABC-type nitrate/sulfonate/bicarbonate transport system permease component
MWGREIVVVQQPANTGQGGDGPSAPPLRAGGAATGLPRVTLIDSVCSTGVGMIVPCAFVLLWWLIVEAGFFPKAVLPSPVSVAKALWEWAFGHPSSGPYSGTLVDAIFASGERVLAGYAIAALLGIVVGVPTGAYRLAGRLMDPFIHLLRPIPVTAWVPLSLVFFGFRFKGAIFLVALGSFFPIVVNTIEGVRGVNRSLVKVARMVGARGLSFLWFFILPASLPAIFVGLRLGIGIAWVLVIVTEMIAVRSGIGYTLLDAYSFNRYDVVMAAMIMLGIMGFLSDRIVVGVQRVLVRWHYEMSIHG